MYIIQEQINNEDWFDKYQCGDYDFILELYHNYICKFPDHKFRVIEVFAYV